MTPALLVASVPLMDLIQNTSSPVFQVKDITKNIRTFLENRFSYVGVQGEISSFTHHSSGHWYFNLKDSGSQISAVMFRGSNQKINFQPKTGEEIIAWGKITVYEPRGNYQLLVSHIERLGDGTLQKNFEKIKLKLKKEGLFDRKRKLPFLPKHIALVTSEKGAALKDVLNVLNRRSKGIKITLSPALMEGKDAAHSVALALKQTFKLKNLDLILVTRGGGSQESLWTFNDESLARLAFESPVPLVSAIGHEIDFTIMDFVSDLRAPTPSAAAELISKNNRELLENIQKNTKNLIQIFSNQLTHKTEILSKIQQTLSSPLSRIEDYLLKCDDYSAQIENCFNNAFERKTQDLSKLNEILIQLNPKNIMKRGWSLCFKNGEVIKNTENLKTKDILDIQFFKGQIKAQVTKKIS